LGGENERDRGIIKRKIKKKKEKDRKRKKSEWFYRYITIKRLLVCWCVAWGSFYKKFLWVLDIF
jgi:hypothetical protein